MAYSETELFALMEAIPAFPHSGYRILQLTNDINCPPKELVRVIEQDPILTMHLLKLVNSEHFGLARKITAIKQAVVFLGINTIKNLALIIAPMELLTRDKVPPRSLTDILRHSLTTAIIARKLAQNLGCSENQATDCYVAGLLHDFGKIALYQLWPDKYGSLLGKLETIEAHSFVDRELQEVSTSHAAIGELLGRQWNLPDLIVQSMGGHHNPDLCATSPLLNCVFAANLIARKMDAIRSGRFSRKEILPSAMIQHFGKDLDSLTASMGLIADEIDHALLLTTIQEDGSMASSMKQP
ncbi:MAG: metal dependent phosphohydrolase [Magnetococcales bacterium]|nr:metal dependent phosphohydrolase [Magnetococcales bacterium]HIJ84744.1 HDOD domain-containing protein [Magnetococcales bacterium]